MGGGVTDIDKFKAPLGMARQVAVVDFDYGDRSEVVRPLARGFFGLRSRDPDEIPAVVVLPKALHIWMIPVSQHLTTDFAGSGGSEVGRPFALALRGT